MMHIVDIPYHLREYSDQRSIIQAFEIKDHIFLESYILIKPDMMFVKENRPYDLTAHHHVCHGKKLAYLGTVLPE